jgi:hypothetical protein
LRRHGKMAVPCPSRPFWLMIWTER